MSIETIQGRNYRFLLKKTGLVNGSCDCFPLHLESQRKNVNNLATRIPSGLSVLLIASEIFGT